MREGNITVSTVQTTPDSYWMEEELKYKANEENNDKHLRWLMNLHSN